MLPSAEALHLRRLRRNLFGVLSEQDLEGNRNPQGGAAEAEERAAAGRMKSPEAVPEQRRDTKRQTLFRAKFSSALVARCFGSAEEFLESDLHRKAACLIVDVRMPKMSGLQLQAKLKEEECNVPIIFITAHGDARMRIQAMREGAVEFLAKPFDHQLLLKRARAALDM
jgi:CheY-like chemotaxis protein